MTISALMNLPLGIAIGWCFGRGFTETGIILLMGAVAFTILEAVWPSD